MKRNNWNEPGRTEWGGRRQSHTSRGKRGNRTWSPDERYEPDNPCRSASAGASTADPTSSSSAASHHSAAPDMKRNNWRDHERPGWGNHRQGHSPRGYRRNKTWSNHRRNEPDSPHHTAEPSTREPSCSTTFQSFPAHGRNNWKGQEDPGWGNQRPSASPHGRRNHKNHWTNDRRNEPGGGCHAPPAKTSISEPSSTTSASQKSPAPELPGFYFDPEKNRYFRLLPGHNNCNPLTTESIKQKEMEGKRLKLLEEDTHRKMSVGSGLNSSLLLRKRKLGLLSSTSYCRLVHQLKVGYMQKKKLEVQSVDASLTGTGNFKLIMADRACEQIFTVNEADHGGCKYGIINLKNLWKDLPQVEMYDNLYFTNRKVNAACWASVTHPDSHVLLCLMGIAETPGCVSLLPASLFSNSSPGDQPGMVCSLRISTAWSCAWCLNPQAHNCFSTGLSRKVLVTNLETGHRQTFGAKSDVLAQQFASQTPLLYNGCRSGEIFSIDIRQNESVGSGSKSIHFFHDTAVTSMQLLEDENYLMATDMAGKIQMWDMRTLKCIKQYDGHHNEYANLPLHVCEEEGLLLSVGQDCYTRIWSLQDTRLLRTIPSPHPISKDAIPSVVFSSKLGGKRGVPGLLMAVKQDLYHFSYNTDN
ncbi:DDB1- and CUL4-associated factor 4 isoform X2 [Ambystoma mexicanum]|uniref:DDB1- and CUL4-associated factor 4 isoform X2 n=1 Tax=Ambystoma mexicanum TaxID=8296 RepID=UPI0037E8B14E